MISLMGSEVIGIFIEVKSTWVEDESKLVEKDEDMLKTMEKDS